jgi:hypothetical protein
MVDQYLAWPRERNRQSNAQRVNSSFEGGTCIVGKKIAFISDHALPLELVNIVHLFQASDHS